METKRNQRNRRRPDVLHERREIKDCGGTSNMDGGGSLPISCENSFHIQTTVLGRKRMFAEMLAGETT